MFEPFLEARKRLVERNAEAAEFVRQEGAGEADIEPSARDCIQHADLAGELERMIENRHDGSGDEPRAPGARRGGGEEDDRVGRIAAVALEIMLDGADMGKAERVGFLGDGERFREIGARALLLGSDAGEELHSELHVFRSLDRGALHVA